MSAHRRGMAGEPAIPLVFFGGGLVQADLLRAEAQAVGVELGAEAAERLMALCALILESPHNLTAIRDPEEMRRKHLVDSLACVPSARVADGELIVDLGSGPGFPGIPIAVVCPRARVVLVEAIGKKVEFLRGAVERLQLSNVTVCQARAEDLGRDPQWRERADCVAARALAPLRVLLELAIPMCRVGGRVIALKGGSVDAEVREAAGALRALGAEVTERRSLVLPGGQEQRVILRVEKRGKTPERYPRRAGVPQRRPL